MVTFVYKSLYDPIKSNTFNTFTPYGLWWELILSGGVLAELILSGGSWLQLLWLNKNCLKMNSP